MLIYVERSGARRSLTEMFRAGRVASLEGLQRRIRFTNLAHRNCFRLVKREKITFPADSRNP